MRGDQETRLRPIHASAAAPAASRKQKSVLKESEILINEHFAHFRYPFNPPTLASCIIQQRIF